MKGSKMEDSEFDRLKGKRVVIIGVGSTGSLIASILAKLGAGLLLVDRDVVEEKNVGRQVLYGLPDVGSSKARIAAGKLSEFTKADWKFEDLTFKNINSLGLEGSNLIIDSTDNTEARLLLNDFCRKNSIAWIHTGASKELGTAMLITPESPCYECVFGEKHGQGCEVDGIYPQTISELSGLACAIAIDWLARGETDRGINRLNSKTGELSKFATKKNPECHACSGKYDYLSGQRSRLAERLCGSNRYLINAQKRIDLKGAEKTLGESVFKATEEAVIARDFIIMANGRIIVDAKSEKDARMKYSRRLGF